MISFLWLGAFRDCNCDLLSKKDNYMGENHLGKNMLDISINLQEVRPLY
jgi:hypothetical protein